jgi:DNA-binding NtrC family response regulator
LAKRVKLYERLEQTRDRDHEVIGESANWKSTLSLASRLAAIPLSGVGAGSEPSEGSGGALPCILLMGETGAGKGVLARYIHSQAEAQAARSGKPVSMAFVHVNCSALPANLVEGELFGHEKGAFTDAREARAGLFEMADGGTIFLDEISEMPLDLQAKLLLVVESGRFRRVGGTKERSVRVRVIAASNQDLEQRVNTGGFRRDLLYRLNAFTIRIPSLRDRAQDAALIAEAAVDRLARRYARPAMRLSTSAHAAILAHDWPGNVRELINAAQRGVMLCDGDTIEPEDLGLSAGVERRAPDMLGEPTRIAPHLPHHSNGHVHGGGPGVALAEPPAAINTSGLRFDFVSGIHTAADVEKELMMQALRFTQGNVSRAARLIGMQRSSLRYRIDRYGLEQYVVEVANR